MLELGSTKAFYALVVASFSIGEAIGSVALGCVSNAIGTKRTLQLCAAISFTGASMYALADLCFRVCSKDAAPWVVLCGRLLQGVGSGGQQAVEQAYLSIAALPEQRTELTGKLSSFACLGFICGPAFAAFVSTLPDVTIGQLVLNSYTKQGWFIALLNVTMYVNGTCCFVEVSASPQKEETEEDGGGRVQGKRSLAIWTMILVFFVHFNGFAVQECATSHRPALLRSRSLSRSPS